MGLLFWGSGTPTFWLGLLLFIKRESRTPNFKILVRTLTSLPGQFQEVHSPDKLSDHDSVAGTLKVFIPPRKKPRHKVYFYQKVTLTL